MPKRISCKELSTLSFAYYVGSDETGKPVYSEVLQSKVQVSQISGNSLRVQYGLNLDYNAIIYAEKNDNTMFIDEATKIWVGKTPLSNSGSSDYSIVRVGTCIDGLIPIYVVSNTETANRLWFAQSVSSPVLSMLVEYSRATKTATIRNNMYFPISAETLVWEQKPYNAEDESNRIQYLGKTVGESSTIIQFGEFNAV